MYMMMNLWESEKLEAEEVCQNTSEKHVTLKAFIESPCKYGLKFWCEGDMWTLLKKMYFPHWAKITK
jgi:hypothetical protein